MYKITKLFLDGNLVGLTISEVTNVRFILGRTYRGYLTGHYRIIKVERIEL